MKRGGDAKDDEEDDDATRGAKKRRVDEAIRAVKVLIEKGKAERMAYRRVLNVTNEIKTIIEDQFPSPHEEAQMQQWKLLYEGIEFLDDMNGYKPLVKETAMKEMEYFRKMRVYTKVHKSVARGHTIISTKWLDTNEGDEATPNYRSRLVGCESALDKRLDLFSATPPLETLKYLIARVAQNQNGPKPWRLATIDVRRAYFYALARRTVFVKIPKEDYE